MGYLDSIVEEMRRKRSAVNTDTELDTSLLPPIDSTNVLPTPPPVAPVPKPLIDVKPTAPVKSRAEQLLERIDRVITPQSDVPMMATHPQQPSVRNRTQLSPDEEQAFQSWYAEKAKIADIDPNPDNPLHKYDYRGAFLAGIEPEINPEDGLYHWPSQFKNDDHPNRFVNGVDTKTEGNVDNIGLVQLQSLSNVMFGTPDRKPPSGRDIVAASPDARDPDYNPEVQAGLNRFSQGRILSGGSDDVAKAKKVAIQNAGVVRDIERKADQRNADIDAALGVDDPRWKPPLVEGQASIDTPDDITTIEDIKRWATDVVTTLGVTGADAVTLGQMGEIPEKWQKIIERSPVAAFVGTLGGMVPAVIGSEGAAIRMFPQLARAVTPTTVAKNLGTAALRGATGQGVYEVTKQGLTGETQDPASAGLDMALGIFGEMGFTRIGLPRKIANLKQARAMLDADVRGNLRESPFPKRLGTQALNNAKELVNYAKEGVPIPRGFKAEQPQGLPTVTPDDATKADIPLSQKTPIIRDSDVTKADIPSTITEDLSQTWYHGTRQKFDTFSDKTVGTGKGSNELGIWFTKSKAEADAIAEYTAKGDFPNTKEASVNAKNKFTVDVAGDVLIPTEATKILKKAKADGYDAVEFKNVKLYGEETTDHLVSLDPSNIKTKGSDSRAGKISTAPSTITEDLSQGKPKPVKEELMAQREGENTATLNNKNRLVKPIKGKTDAEIVGYEWASTLEEGMFRDKRVSDWERAQTSVPTGRKIVHLFWVKTPDGAETLMGVGAAKKALGLDESRLYTIAKQERQAQIAAKQQRESFLQSADKRALDTEIDASRKWREVNNPKNMSFGNPADNQRMFDERFAETKLLTKDGKFIRTGLANDIELLKEGGWTDVADSRAGKISTAPAKVPDAAERPAQSTISQSDIPELPPAVREVGQKPITSETPPIQEPSSAVDEAVTGVPSRGVVNATNATFDEVRAEFGLERLTDAERKTFEQTMAGAIEKGYDKNALEIAEQILSDAKIGHTDEEIAGVAKATAERIIAFKKMNAEALWLSREGKTEQARAALVGESAIRDEIDILTRASKLAGMEVGRALNARKLTLSLDDLEITSVLQRAEVSKGSRLTPEETANYKMIVSEHKAMGVRVAELEESNLARQVEIDRLSAQKVVDKKVKETKAKGERGDYRKKVQGEINDIYKELEELGVRVTVGIDPQEMYLYGKLAVKYIELGASSVEEVIRLVRAKLPHLTDNEIIEAIGTKDPSRQAKAMTDAMRTKGELLTQFDLMKNILHAKDSIFAEGRKTPVSSDEVRALRKELKALTPKLTRTISDGVRLGRAQDLLTKLQKELATGLRSAKRTKRFDPEDLAGIKADIQGLRKIMRTEDEIALLREQLKTGNILPKPRRVTQEMSPELMRGKIELQRLREQIEAEIAELQPLTPLGIITKIESTFRTAKATGDISYLARQGGLFLAAHPIRAVKVFGRSLKAMVSEFDAQKIDMELRNSNEYYIGKKHGLYYSDINSRLTKPEEYFQSNYLEKVPVVESIVRGSERNMATGLNLIRHEMLKDFIKKHPNATPKELREWAQFINHSTGRGTLPVGFASGASHVLFAPRFTASRFEVPLAAFLSMANGTPRVTKEIAKEQARALSTAATVLFMLKMSGAEIGVDPLESDFGKGVIGNIYIDIFAGIQQPTRLAYGIIYAAAKIAMDEKPKIDTRRSVEKFLEYKAAPLVSAGWELTTGKDAVGQKVTKTGALINLVTPIIVGEMFSAYEKGDDPNLALTLTAILGSSGVGTSTYNPKGKASKKQRDEYRELMERIRSEK